MERKSILVIEDHASIRLLLSKFLEKTYDVVTKRDGMDGLAWLSQGNLPDLIILDMSMPRLSGVEFLTNIRSSGFFKDLPVIVVSAEEGKGLVEQCHQLGIKGFINKPFNPIDLNDKIAQILLPKRKVISNS